MTKQCLNNPRQPGRRIYIFTCTLIQLIVCHTRCMSLVYLLSYSH